MSAGSRRKPVVRPDTPAVVPFVADRLPPHNIEAEEGVIGACLQDIDGSVFPAVAAVLQVGDFYRDAHQVIFGAMLRLHRGGKPTEPILVDEELRRTEERDRIGDDFALGEFVRRVNHTLDALPHAHLVKHKAIARDVIAHAESIIEDGYANRLLVPELLGRAVTGLAEIDDAFRSVTSAYAGIADEDIGIVAAEKVEPENIEWLWDNRIAKGKFGLWAGEGSDGKSTLLMAIIASVTARKPFPDGTIPSECGTCLILAAEDGQRDTILPRLIAAGADLTRVKIIKAQVVTKARDGRQMIDFKSFQDLDYWEEILARVPDTRMIVADPIPAYLGRGVNDNHNLEVRGVMEPFLLFLEDRGVTLQGITHLGKSSDSRTPTHKILGSVAYSNLARIIHLTSRDPDDQDRRLLFNPKNNIAPNQSTLAYKVTQAEIEAKGGPIRTSRVEFEAGIVETSAAEVFEAARSPSKKRGPSPAQYTKVAAWLYDFLAAEGQATPLAKIIDAAGEAGFAGKQKDDGKWSNPMIVYRAKDLLPELGEPRDGWTIAEEERRFGTGGRPIKHWRLIGVRSDF